MDASSAISPESFSIFAVFMRADWVVKLVMAGLAIASLWSWTIIIDKSFRFHALNRHADRFEDQVSSGQPLEDIANAEGERPNRPCHACCRRRCATGARAGPR